MRLCYVFSKLRKTFICHFAGFRLGIELEIAEEVVYKGVPP